MASSNEEPAKQLLPFLQRADELQKHDRLVAYYCRLYAMEKGLKIPSKERTKDTNALLLSLMGQLEKDKKAVQLSPEDNLHVEGFAQEVFTKADKTDRAGRADLNTAKTFYAASIFFEVLRQWAELSPEFETKQKYAIWKAADIRKAIADGRKPTPGPPGGDPEPYASSTEEPEFPAVPSKNEGTGSQFPPPSQNVDMGNGFPSGPRGGGGGGGGGGGREDTSQDHSYYSDDIDLPSAPSAPPRFTPSRSFSQQDAPMDTKGFTNTPLYPPGYGNSQPPSYDRSSQPPFPQPPSYAPSVFPDPHIPQFPPHSSHSSHSPHPPPPPPSHPPHNFSGYNTGQSPPSDSRPSGLSGYPTGPSLPPPDSRPGTLSGYPTGPTSGYPTGPSLPPSESRPGTLSGYPTGPSSHPSPSSGPPFDSHPNPQIPKTQNAHVPTTGKPSSSLPTSSPPFSASPTTSTSASRASDVTGVGGGEYDSSYVPPPEKCTEAHKASRFAVSALAFDDIPTAVSYLQRALKLLTSPNAAI